MQLACFRRDPLIFHGATIQENLDSRCGQLAATIADPSVKRVGLGNPTYNLE